MKQQILLYIIYFEEVVNYIIGLRKEDRNNKDWKTSDKICDFLKNSGLEIKVQNGN